MFVWPGNSQTDKVFIDATQWWKVAEREGFILVTICEQYSNTSISVSHRDSNTFYRQLRELMINEYPVDATRFYSTGQSAGSSVTQNFAIAFPEYFAAVASTSFTAAPNAAGNVTIDGVSYPASGRMIPNYQIYGYGDLGFLEGDALGRHRRTHSTAGRSTTSRPTGSPSMTSTTSGGEFSGWRDRFIRRGRGAIRLSGSRC